MCAFREEKKLIFSLSVMKEELTIFIQFFPFKKIKLEEENFDSERENKSFSIIFALSHTAEDERNLQIES